MKDTSTLLLPASIFRQLLIPRHGGRDQKLWEWEWERQYRSEQNSRQNHSITSHPDTP